MAIVRHLRLFFCQKFQNGDYLGIIVFFGFNHCIFVYLICLYVYAIINRSEFEVKFNILIQPKIKCEGMQNN